MSAGNRAYYSIGSPSNVSAPSIQRLLDMGGHLVGSTKTAPFATARLPSFARR